MAAKSGKAETSEDKAVEPLVLVLPLPPSTNKLWRPVRRGSSIGFAKTDVYNQWMANAVWEVKLQRSGSCIKGNFRIAMIMPETRGDADNRIKACLDACQHGGAITNDKFCVGGSWDVDDTREGTVLLTLTPL